MDSTYAIALVSPRDQHHVHALSLFREIEAQDTRVVTTRAVEVGDALSRQSLRSRAVSLITSFDRDPRIEVTPLSEELYERAMAFFEQHRDKEWGLTDCISFVVMKDRGLTDALTADAHFRQAGFRPLLRAP